MLGPFGLVGGTRIVINEVAAWRERRRQPQLVWGSGERVAAVEDIMADLIPKVFGFSYYDCYISDDSSLTDFEPHHPASRSLEKIAAEYGIDTAALPDMKLVTIAEAIAASSAGSSAGET
jgi:hypothetical protein